MTITSVGRTPNREGLFCEGREKLVDFGTLYIVECLQ